MSVLGKELTQEEAPWQIMMFQRSLKKQLKLNALLEFAGDLTGKRCLLVTCGDNNGALNWFFRAHGGIWTWADVEGKNLDQINELLGEPVLLLPEDEFPLDNECYDCIIAIDVLEHLEKDQPFLQELNRVLKAGGVAIITVPNGDAVLLANRIKWRVGMVPEVYGHTRAGYTLEELNASITKAGLIPVGDGGYSRFFTEMLELLINYSYVYLLSRKENDKNQGQIAPTTSRELKNHGTTYQLYSLVFPLVRLISKLDNILSEETNNAVIVSAIKPVNKVEN